MMCIGFKCRKIGTNHRRSSIRCLGKRSRMAHISAEALDDPILNKDQPLGLIAWRGGTNQQDTKYRIICRATTAPITDFHLKPGKPKKRQPFEDSALPASKSCCWKGCLPLAGRSLSSSSCRAG